MTLVDRFEAYAADFERTFADDDWTRLEAHFTEDAVYSTPANAMRVDGRDLVLAALRLSVTTFDRQCASRTLVTTRGPEEHGDEVRREWAATYGVPGAPQLDIEGAERAVFRNGRIAFLEVTMTPDTLAQLMEFAAIHLPRG